MKPNISSSKYYYNKKKPKRIFQLFYFGSIFAIMSAIIVCVTISNTTHNKIYAQTIHVNEQQYRTNSYSGGSYQNPGSWSGWSNWTADGTNYRGFSSIASYVTSLANSGGIVELCTHNLNTNTPYSPSSPYYSDGTSTEYRSGWPPNGASTTSAGGTMTVNSGFTVQLNNTLFTSSFNITNITKNGGGTLILGYTGTQFTVTTTTNFDGQAGTFQIGDSASPYTSTYTNVGGTTWFTASVNSGKTWNANTLTAHDYFKATGYGTLAATSTVITGLTESNITNFTTAGLTVGNSTNGGHLNITAGTVNTTSAAIANAAQSNTTTGSEYNGMVTVGAGTVWNTINSPVTVGNASNAKGQINIAGTWSASGSDTQDIDIGNVAGSYGEVNLTGTWIVTNPDLNIGLNGTGVVNQTAGSWTDDHTIAAVNDGSIGTINQSGGTHSDKLAIIGVGSTSNTTTRSRALGYANLSGGAWNTNNADNDASGSADLAIIGDNYSGEGYVKVYGSSSAAIWTIGDVNDLDNLITADEGIGTLEIYNDGYQGTVKVFGNHIIAQEASGYGTDRVHTDGLLNVEGNMVTGSEGKAQLKIYNRGKTTVTGNHTIAEIADSYGSDQVDGNGSQLNVTGNMIVGDDGQAGGHYVYHPYKESGYANYPDSSAGAYNGGGDYLDPTKNSTHSNKWLESPNLDLRPDDTDWTNKYEDDAPGLAITGGGKVVVGTNTAGAVKNANVSVQDGSYAYILLDNIDNTDPNTGRSEWLITNSLTMGVDKRTTNSDLEDAYMRILNGSLVQVHGTATIASGEGTEVTVRVNGKDNATTPNPAEFKVGNLIVAKGSTGTNLTDKAEGNLYVYDGGLVDVGRLGVAGTLATNDPPKMTIAEDVNSLGRAHVDGTGSKVDVNGILIVADKGHAGGEYNYNSTTLNNKDNNPKNDHKEDPSYFENFGQWFDSANTLSDLKVAGGVNDNAPGLLITRGAEVVSSSASVAKTAGSYAYVVIDGEGAAAEKTKWTVNGQSDRANDTGNLIIADAGKAYMRVFNGGLLETKNTNNPAEGDIIIADKSTAVGTVRIFGTGSKIHSEKNLIVANEIGSDGQLYIYHGATGFVKENMTISNDAGSKAQVQIDGDKTTLNVTERLTVGHAGKAGGRYNYNENRYDVGSITNPDGYRVDPSETDNPPSFPQSNLYDPDHVGAKWWFDSENMNLRENEEFAGNAPGLAITDGAIVDSASGLVASEAGSIGYVVIDNRFGFEETKDTRTKRSTWKVSGTDTGLISTKNGDLVIGRQGEGFVRVLNGGLLEVEGHTKLNSWLGTGDAAYINPVSGKGSLYVFGNGGDKRATPSTAKFDKVPDYVTPYADGNRSTWISKKATILGDTNNLGTLAAGGEATIRINNGAYGETYGIFAGYGKHSRGDVSVMGKGSELHVKAANETQYSVNNIEGTGGLSVSDNALLQLHENGNITINGIAGISHNSLLHLDDGSEINTRDYSVKIINARVEGIGRVTGENGVTFIYDSTYHDSVTDPVYSEVGGKLHTKVTRFTSTQIDPGLYYGWGDTSEYYKRYGKLTFGDRLTLVGNVTTMIDVNSGWPIIDSNAPNGLDPNDIQQMNDTIVVERDNTPPNNSTADIIAQLSGTLKIHARLTNYFQDEPSFLIVKTVGDDASTVFKPGKIVTMFDRLEIVPWRFFDDPHQEVVKYDDDDNEGLRISMKLKTNPFEEAGKTYNEKSTGKALDSIYALRKTEWLPVLRYFWYLEDPDFLNAYSTLSGEVRAHSMHLPLQSPWNYNQNRYDYRIAPQSYRSSNRNRDLSNPRNPRNPNSKIDLDKSNLIDESIILGQSDPIYSPTFKEKALDPCGANGEIVCNPRWEKFKRCLKRCIKDTRVWGEFIYDHSQYDSDGNAAAFTLSRSGGVVGIDKPTCDKKHILGFQFAFSEAELDTFRAEAKVADFNFGIYHSKKIHSIFVWQNFLGMGIQNYKTKRTIDTGLSDYDWIWNDPANPNYGDPSNGHYGMQDEDTNDRTLRSKYRGYTFYANTEIARPFIFGTSDQYMIRPFAAIDVIGAWQNSANEYNNDPKFTNAKFVLLKFHTASNIRTLARMGINFERNGNHLNLHSGLSYNFQLGGRHYMNVNNQFQFAGDVFNIRSTNTGNDYLNLNIGSELYLGKKKNQYIMLNYQALFGKNLTTQAVQLGYQYKF
jgi:hypothetical protein